MLLLVPAIIDFGCVAQGFTYSVDAVVTNNDFRKQRIKVTCVKLRGSELNKVTATTSSQPFAPGLSTVVKVEFRAETAATTSEYEVVIIMENNKEELRCKVSSIVIPMEIFKYFAKSLRLQKRPVTKPGVTVVEAINAAAMAATGGTGGTFEDKSFYSTTGTAITNTTSGQSIFSEALLDTDDIDDLLEMPMAPNMFWDVAASTLKVDKEASKIIVDGKLSLAECVACTEMLRDKRQQELEVQGFYTQSAIERIRVQMFSSSINLSEDDYLPYEEELEAKEEEEEEDNM